MRLFQDQQDRRYLAMKYSARLNDSYVGSIDQTINWEIAKFNILRIKQIAEKRNAKVGFVVFPILVELNEHYPFAPICETLINFATEYGIPTHNLLPAFIGKHAPDLWVSSFDQHPNSVAHKIAAHSIQPFLKRLIENNH
jgi:hypothetical protein